MREILFRGKRINNREWVYGNLLRYQDGACAIAVPQNQISMLQFDVVSETVGQYTGLTDKNGTRIFEGDILSASLDDLFPENQTVLAVVWHDCGWHGRYLYGLNDSEPDMMIWLLSFGGSKSIGNSMRRAARQNSRIRCLSKQCKNMIILRMHCSGRNGI